MELQDSNITVSNGGQLVKKHHSTDPLLLRSEESEADTTQFSEETMLIAVEQSTASSGYGATADPQDNLRAGWESDEAPLLEEVRGGGR